MAMNTIFEYKYNKDFKEMYLNTLDNFTESENTLKATERILRKISSYEEKNSKNVYDFSSEEIVNMFKDMRFATEMSYLNNRSILSKYCNFAILKNVTREPKNAMDVALNGIDNSEIINVNALENKYFTIRNLYEILEEKLFVTDIDGECHVVSEDHKLINYTDKLIIYALWLGIGVKSKAYEDLTNLELSDLNEEKNEIILPKTKIVMKDIPSDFFEYCKKSCKQTKYEIRHSKKNSITLDASSGKIIKPAISIRNGEDVTVDSIKQSKIQSVLRAVQQMSFQFLYANPTSLIYSGMAHYLGVYLLENNLELNNINAKVFVEERYGITEAHYAIQLVKVFKTIYTDLEGFEDFIYTYRNVKLKESAITTE